MSGLEPSSQVFSKLKVSSFTMLTSELTARFAGPTPMSTVGVQSIVIISVSILYSDTTLLLRENGCAIAALVVKASASTVVVIVFIFVPQIKMQC